MKYLLAYLRRVSYLGHSEIIVRMAEAGHHDLLTNRMITPDCRTLESGIDALDNADAMMNEKISKMKGSELSRLANLVLVDARLIFVIVSVYITISSAIMSAANNEAAADASGNGTFELSTSGGHGDHYDISDVSNSVLWNCREQAVSRRYYRLLYGSLLGAFGFILLLFLSTRLSILWGNMRPEMDHLHEAMWHIQIIKYLRFYLESKIPGNQATTNQTCEKLVKNLSKVTECPKHKNGKARLCSLLIIPFSQAVFLITSLPFMLTTYDLNPIGCLVGPDEDAIEYNNVTGRLQLQFTKGVLNYQTAALVVFLVLMLGSVLIFASLLLLHYLRITKNILKEIAEKVMNYQDS